MSTQFAEFAETADRPDLPPVILDPASTPAAIEARSFAIIDAEIAEPRPFAGPLWQVARRCIHTLGDTAILADLRLSQTALEQGLAALRQGCTIYTDTRMAAAGLPLRRLAPLGVTVQPLMALPGLEAAAKAQGMTRSRAGIAMIADRLAGQIVVIGNAPTALLGLLEELEKRKASPADNRADNRAASQTDSQANSPAGGPALIVGMPVGFVNAAQAKELLHRSPWPHFTLLGRKGGSAVAAASVNALAELALPGEQGI